MCLTTGMEASLKCFAVIKYTIRIDIHPRPFPFSANQAVRSGQTLRDCGCSASCHCARFLSAASFHTCKHPNYLVILPCKLFTASAKKPSMLNAFRIRPTRECVVGGWWSQSAWHRMAFSIAFSEMVPQQLYPPLYFLPSILFVLTHNSRADSCLSPLLLFFFFLLPHHLGKSNCREGLLSQIMGQYLYR